MMDSVRIRFTYDDEVRSYPEDPALHLPRHDAERLLGQIGFDGQFEGREPRRARILAGDECDCR